MNKRRLLCILLALMMLICIIPANVFAATTSGSCGSNVTWEYNSKTKTLTLSGSGHTNNYQPKYMLLQAKTPWLDLLTKIEKVVIGEGITYIGDYLFFGLENVKEVSLPSTLESIGDATFGKCKSLGTIDFPETLKEIWSNAFYQCTSLKRIVLPDSIETISVNAFAECSNLSEVVFPEYKERLTLHTGILAKTSVTEVVLPKGLRILATGAFRDHKNLENITLPEELRVIDEYVFSGCSSLKKLTLPESVVLIGPNSFSGCTGLTEFTVPDGQRTIYNHTFADCTALEKIYIPYSVNTIKASAFGQCDALTDIYYGGTEEDWNKIVIEKTNNESLLNATVHYEAAGNKYLSRVYSDTPSTLYPTDDVVSVTTDGTVYITGSDTASISVPNDLQMLVKKIVIGEGITDISGNCSGCVNTEEIIFPSTLETINYYANFQGTKIKEIKLPESLKFIDSSAFSGSNELKEVIIPKNVRKITAGAFSNCDNLENVYVISEDIQLHEWSFSWGSSLKNIYFAIGTNNLPSLSGQPELEYVSVPLSVRSTAIHTFQDNTALKAVVFHEGLDYITSQAFLHCTALEHIVIPSSVTSIEHSAFDSDVPPKNIHFLGTKDEWDSITKYVDEDVFERININYNVRFLPMDLRGGIAGQELIILEDGTVLTIGNQLPALPGAKFSGWTTDKNSSEPMFLPGEEINVTKDDTLYALWECEHEWISDKMLSGATCLSPSIYSQICKTCGAKGENITVGENGEHSFSDWVIKEEATSDKDGIKERKCSICNETQTETIRHFVPGDVNNDGKINALDATQILRYANNKPSVITGVEKDSALYNAADVNSDGKINALDATQILRYANNKPSVLSK